MTNSTCYFEVMRFFMTIKWLSESRRI